MIEAVSCQDKLGDPAVNKIFMFLKSGVTISVTKILKWAAHSESSNWGLYQ